MPRESEPLRWGRFGRLAQEEYASRQALDGIAGTVLTFSNSHPTTLDNLQNMGMTLVARGRLDEADMALRRAWAGRQVLLGHEHPMTLRSQRDLRGAMHRRGRIDNTEDFETQRQRMAQTALTPFKDTIDNTAQVRRRGGLVAQVKGKKDFLDAAEGARGLRGKLETDTEFILGDRGGDDRDTSQECLVDCEKILRSRTPAGGPATVGDFGTLLGKLNQLEKAEALLQKSMKARQLLYGEAHPKTMGATMDLIDVLKKLGRLGAAEALLDKKEQMEMQMQSMNKSMSDSALPRSVQLSYEL